MLDQEAALVLDLRLLKALPEWARHQLDHLDQILAALPPAHRRHLHDQARCLPSQDLLSKDRRHLRIWVFPKGSKTAIALSCKWHENEACTYKAVHECFNEMRK